MTNEEIPDDAVSMDWFLRKVRTYRQAGYEKKAAVAMAAEDGIEKIDGDVE